MKVKASIKIQQPGDQLVKRGGRPFPIQKKKTPPQKTPKKKKIKKKKKKKKGEKKNKTAGRSARKGGRALLSYKKKKPPPQGAPGLAPIFNLQFSIYKYAYSRRYNSG